VAHLVSEVDNGGSDFRRATIAEVLRVRTVIDVAGRRVRSPDVRLGNYHIPQGRTVLVRIEDLHEDRDSFPLPERFDPGRFLGSAPPPAWLAFGGGARRCLGADFAIAEMDVVLRTVLAHFQIHTDAAPDEKPRFRGIAHVPARGGRVVVSRRR
jgi:cytochrome P450